MAIARLMGMGALSHTCLFVYLFVLQLCYRCATNLKCNVQRDSKLLYFATFRELLLQYVLDFCIWTFVCLLYAVGALCQLFHIALTQGLSSIDHVEMIWGKYCDIVALSWYPLCAHPTSVLLITLLSIEKVFESFPKGKYGYLHSQSRIHPTIKHCEEKWQNMVFLPAGIILNSWVLVIAGRQSRRYMLSRFAFILFGLYS